MPRGAFWSRLPNYRSIQARLRRSSSGVISLRKIALAAAFAGMALAPAVRADSRFEPPVPVRTVAPDFPNDLRNKGISGIVMVNVLIDAQGNPQDLKVTKSSNSAFEEPAVEALRKWKFKPAERDGANVALRVVIPIRFSVDD
jgi:protein TonB